MEKDFILPTDDRVTCAHWHKSHGLYAKAVEKCDNVETLMVWLSEYNLLSIVEKRLDFYEVFEGILWNTTCNKNYNDLKFISFIRSLAPHFDTMVFYYNGKDMWLDEIIVKMVAPTYMLLTCRYVQRPSL